MISKNLQLGHAITSVFTEDGSAKVALFTENLAELRPVLLAYLVTKTGGDPNAAADCLQEVAVVLWKKHDSNWSPEDFRRYAFRCADIEARSYLRKCRRVSKRIVFLAPDVVQALGNETQQQDAADPVPGRRRLDALQQCLDGLDPVQRQLLDARYEKDGVGKRVADIAKEESCKMETLYKRLERIRTSLQICISKRLKDLPT
jgi:RNA polymerase sigma factor (sigma-70 family)